MAISREEIVRAAVRLLDEVGLEGLTLRRLAERLDVSAPTLYWHVDDKRHLLDLMVHEILGAVPLRPAPADHEPWWQWLATNARLQRGAMLSVRDGALVVGGNRPTEESLPHIEQMLHSLVDVGFPPDQALRTVLAIGDYVIGSAIEQQASTERRFSQRDGSLAAAMRGGAHPTLETASRGFFDGGMEHIFEAGLSWMIEGLRIEHAAMIATVSSD